MNPELRHYLHLIDNLRGQVKACVADLPAEALNWRPLPGVDDHAMNSLAVLGAHVAGAEHFWIAEVIGCYPQTRVRSREFVTEVDGPSDLTSLLDAVEHETREVLAGLTEADLDGVREARGKTVTVRWCILHVIDHIALHLGHMQITYQLWMHGKSHPSPRWFERLP